MTQEAPPQRASGEHSLFVRHMRAGESLFESGRLPEAARELEEAYLLRPRDHRVLNLLGLIYFKQEDHERAEEIYRKLASESPDSHTLFYNLGLVYLKLNRAEEAEKALLRALELSGGNPKVHFYLGSIYERMQRLPDAIFHYRQAGTPGFSRHPPRRPAAAPPKGSADTAPGLPASAARRADTAPLRPAPVDEGTRPLSTEAVAAALEDGFQLIQPDLLEVRSSRKVFVKQGTVHSYAGNLRFWVREKRAGGEAGIAIVTGSGKLLLRDRDRAIRLVPLKDVQLVVQPACLVACEEALAPTWVAVGEGPQAREFLRLDGRGRAAISVGSRPLTLEVTPTMPASVAAATVLHWSGSLRASFLQDDGVAAVLRADAREGGPILRLEGTGEVTIEQV
jgi:Flp pilus assembly protein TadD/uncharacterized protein (AIM24 family)